MTVEEWDAMDKKPGMKFRTPDGKVGRLVSVHKDGATLDFTDENDYRHVLRGFYRCVQLSQVGDPAPAAPPKPKTRVKGATRKNSHYICYGKVMREKTGDVFASAYEASVCLGVQAKTILRSCIENLPIGKGAYKGECFKLLEAQK